MTIILKVLIQTDKGNVRIDGSDLQECIAKFHETYPATELKSLVILQRLEEKETKDA